MRLLDPETFVDQPYIAGLNQGGHMIAGAALFAGAFWLGGAPAGAAVAFLVPLALEIWQLDRRDGVLWDGLLDLLFWYIGAASWGLVVMTGDVAGPAILYPLLTVLNMGIVMAVFTFFKARSKGD